MNWTFGLHIDIQKNRIVNICSRKRTQFQVPLPICIFSLLFLDVFFLSRFAKNLKRSHQTNGNRTNTFGKNFKVSNYWLSGTDGTNEWQHRKKHKISIGTKSVCVWCVYQYIRNTFDSLSLVCLQIVSLAVVSGCCVSECICIESTIDYLHANECVMCK